MRGHLHQEFASQPFMSPVGDGVFLTYSDINLQQQRLIWMDHSGNILHQDSLSLPFIEFAYTDRDLAFLISFRQDYIQRSASYTVFTYNPQGELVGQTSLLDIQFDTDESHGGHAFRFQQGTLTLVSAIVRDGQPLSYKLRMVRFDGENAVHTGAFDLGNAPAQGFLFGWTVARDGWGQSLVGFYAQTSQRTLELRFIGFDSAGMLGSLAHTVTNGDTSICNGLDLFIANRSVYCLYTTQARTASAQGGTYLLAFPLDEVLEVAEHLVPVPRAADLAAFPNPFNATVRFEYTLPETGPARISIYDIAGRRVETLNIRNNTTAGDVWWSPGNLTSGTYFARMSGANAQVTRKIVLLK